MCSEKFMNDFDDHPVRFIAKVSASVVALLVVVALIGNTLGFVSLWGSEAKRIVSPDNVKDQYAVIIEQWESLSAAADNACQASKDSESSSDDPVLVEGPALAYAATYRNSRVEYNRRQANIFEAKKVGPPGYPKEIPRFAETSGSNPDWCAVSDKLAELRDQ